MKTILLLFLFLFIHLLLFASPFSERDAVRAIVGEAANQGERGMLALAGAIRNRGTLKGVYGLKNPSADKQPAWVWRQAERAWAMSATNDLSLGATHWENTKAFGVPYWAASMQVTVIIKDHTFYISRTAGTKHKPKPKEAL